MTGLINFYKGLEENYSSDTHSEGIYQCTDTGNTYVFGVLNKDSGSDLTIGETAGTAFDGGRGKAVEDIVNNIKNERIVTRIERNDIFGRDVNNLRVEFVVPSTGAESSYDVQFKAATTELAGLMSTADKQKLDNLSTEAYPTFSLTGDLASGSGVISSLVWERLTAARTANTPIVVVNDMGSLPVANVAILSFGHNTQQQGTTDIIMPARINDLEDYTVTQTVYQITGGGSTYQIATVTKNLKFHDSGDGTKFLSDDGTYKAIEIPDISNLATKDELSAKVSGTGVTKMQVVTELPESPDASTLYILTAAEETA